MLKHHAYVSFSSRRRLIVDLVAAAAGVDTTYAPPAIVCKSPVSIVRAPTHPRHMQCRVCHTFLHALQFQIPVECLFTVVLPQNVHV